MQHILKRSLPIIREAYNIGEVGTTGGVNSCSSSNMLNIL
jgi:hypothetical protein